MSASESTSPDCRQPRDRPARDRADKHSVAAGVDYVGSQAAALLVTIGWPGRISAEARAPLNYSAVLPAHRSAFSNWVRPETTYIAHH